MLENFKFLKESDWRIIIEKGYTIIVNKHTGCQYVLQKISSNSRHLLQIYKDRVQSTIPHTPQIILGDHNQHFFIDAFIQYAPFTIGKVVRKTSSEKFITQKIKVILDSVECLVKKYGFFRVSNKMLRVTNTMNILIWIHDNFSATHRQYPLSSSNIYQDYKTMINNILTIILQQDYKNLLEKLRRKIQEQKYLNFEKFYSILQNITRSTQKKTIQRLPSFIKRKNSNRNSNTKIKQQNPGCLSKSTCLGNSELKYNQLETRRNINGQRAKQSGFINRRSKDNTRSLLLFKSMSPKIKRISSDIKTQDECISPCSVSFLKNKIRNSGKSLASTAPMRSILSSGSIRQKLIQNIQEQEAKIEITPFQDLEQKKVKQSFRIHTSRIIYENNQQIGTPASPKNIQKERKRYQFSQFQKQFNLVFNSCHNEQASQDLMPQIIMELERDLNNILFL